MTLFNDKIVLIGPYVGSFEEEIFTFRPFVYWLIDNFDFPNLIVSTHYDREFLYNDIDIIPIFKQYTNDQINQRNHKHQKISIKDYQYLINDTKDQIADISKFNKSDIIVYNIGYAYSPNVSIFNKHFKPIDNRKQSNNNIIYIPDASRTEKEHDRLWTEYLKDVDGIILMRDCKSRISKHKQESCSYKDMIDDILSCKAVITPSSRWTFLCNQHGVPVFSWGKHTAQYKEIYNFGNKCNTLSITKKDVNKIIGGMKNFLKEIK